MAFHETLAPDSSDLRDSLDEDDVKTNIVPAPKERVISKGSPLPKSICAFHFEYLAKSTWKYINLKPDSKDKYTIELSASVRVPDNFIMKSKRGSGPKQVNRYRTAYLDRLVPPSNHPSMSYLRHTLEGPDDMPAHIKAAFLPPSLSVPVLDGQMMLGTWQGIFLVEHRARPHSREVVLGFQEHPPA